jgi:hypothetical protein
MATPLFCRIHPCPNHIRQMRCDGNTSDLAATILALALLMVLTPVIGRLWKAWRHSA